MKYKTFEDRVLGLDQISTLKIRDPASPLPRGYNISVRGDFYLLTAIDGSVQVNFNEFGVVPSYKPVPLYINGVTVGAINIADMEVIE